MDHHVQMRSGPQVNQHGDHNMIYPGRAVKMEGPGAALETASIRRCYTVAAIRKPPLLGHTGITVEADPESPRDRSSQLLMAQIAYGRIAHHRNSTKSGCPFGPIAPAGKGLICRRLISEICIFIVGLLKAVSPWFFSAATASLRFNEPVHRHSSAASMAPRLRQREW